MWACFGGSGLALTLSASDKQKAEDIGELECCLKEWKKAKLVLHIVDEVTEKGFLEEPGFHIKAIPKGGGPESKTRYDIFLSKERFEKLTNPEDPIVQGGYFVSRSIYDRVDIMYFGL